MPSWALEVIPPAYPAPSPHANNPQILVINSSFLTICTGALERLSTPIKRFSSSANPLILLLNLGRASFKDSVTNSGKHLLKSASVTPVYKKA